MTPYDIAAALVRADWPAADLARLRALIALGPPSAMHASAPPAPTDSRTEHGIREVWITGKDAEMRAEALGMWRRIGMSCGHPLPPPGKVK